MPDCTKRIEKAADARIITPAERAKLLREHTLCRGIGRCAFEVEELAVARTTERRKSA